MTGRISGKRALVTGSASGIGRAIALRLAHEGAKVGLVDLNEQALAETVAQIESEGGEALALPTDVTQEEQVERTVARAVETWGGLDVLVASAAVQFFGKDARVDQLELSVWQKTIDVNLTGVFLSCKHSIRAMLKSGGGSVICIASPTSFFGMARGFDAYTASKAGVFGLVRVMANDYAREGIRVNAVVPGFTDTPLVRSIIKDEASLARQVQTIPMGRPGKPEEVASMVLFLASDEASFATGGAYMMDGGETAI